ncbi:chondroitin sulfate proteoglycan 4-like isoform X2 [Haliotis cracherodii]|uniref:chondroitin sulfate proteoglycan 4-like isoform X2 n=1 Tax=Haliotis cracherodii TaxID=6455 RepID=UPI0039E96339
MVASKGPGVLLILSWVCVCANAESWPSSFYGESYIRVPFQEASKSSEIKLYFKTHRPHGLLLLAAGTTDYFAVELRSGIVKVRVNLGSGEATVQSTPGLRLDDLQWHFVHINRTQSKVTLNVDNVVLSTVETPGSYHELNIEHGIFLGGIGTFTDVYIGNFPNFRGCQRNVFFNGYDILRQARLLNSPLYTFEIFWDCDDEFDAGSYKPISFNTETSFVAFPHLHIRTEGTFSCDLVTKADNAIVLFNSGRRSSAQDFIALEILKGKLQLSINSGSGIISVSSDIVVNDGLWHQIDMILTTTTMELSVDEVRKETTFNLGDNQYLNLAGHMFVGGLGLKARTHAIKIGLESLQGDRGMKGSMTGCIKNIVVNKRTYGFRDVQISRLVDPQCSGRFPCAPEPCIEGAKCVEVNKEDFQCVCDKTVCTKETPDKNPGVVSSNDPREVLAIEELKVQEGAEAAITTNIIDVIFDYQAYRLRESAIMFHVKVAPQYGRIDVNLRRRRNGGKFTLLDLIGEKISYIHDGTDTRSDDVTLEMTISPDSQSVPKKYKGTFAFVVPIKIIPRNDPPKIIVPSGNVIQVIERSKFQMTKLVLDIIDPDSDPSNLEYSVTYLRQGGGYFEKSNATGQRLKTFTQADINTGLIWFVHEGQSTSFLRLKASDESSNSDAVDLRFTAVDMNLEITANSGIFVFHGMSKLILPENLTTVTNVPSQQIEIRYRISQQPKYGEIQRRQHGDEEWTPVETFSQRHIDKKRLRYSQTNFGQFPTSDSCMFTVTAKDVSLSDTVFQIVFQTVTLRLQNIAKLVVLHSPYTVLKNEHFLAVANTEIPADRIFISIMRPPSQGGLYIFRNPVRDVTEFDQRRALTRNSNFTQQQINEEKVYFKVYKPSFKKFEDFLDLKISFAGAESIMTRFLVEYIPMKSSVRFTNNGLKNVIEGGKKVIEKDDLFLEMDSYRDFQFSIMTPTKHGSLKLIDPRSQAVLANDISRFTTKDIQQGKLTYQHDDSEHSEDSFMFSAAPIINTADKAMEIQEFSGTFSIQIRMRNDNPPAILINRVFHIVKNKERLLTIDDLEAIDPDIEYDSDKLKFTRKGMRNGEILDSNTKEPVFEFSQEDLKEKKLVVKHRGADSDQAAIFVTDGQFVKPFLFQIRASDPYIKITNNTGIKVQKGSYASMTTTNLSVETNVDVTPEEINFVLTEEPSNGHLRIRGKMVSEFTFADIIAGNVRYWNDGGNEMEDKFKFAVLAKEARVNGVFPVMVFLESQMHPPEIVHNRFLEVPEGSSATITKGHLHVVHPAALPKNIVFTIETLPSHGDLKIKGRTVQNLAQARFSQSDIDSGLVAYAPREVNFLTDKIVFEVTNGIQTLSNLEFFIEIVPAHLPLIAKNLTVIEGARIQLTNKMISVKGRYFMGKDINFKIVVQPSHGWIYSNDREGTHIDTFTSADLANNKVFYEHNNDESLTDSFSMIAQMADNSKRSLQQTVYVKVIPINDKPPRVVVNKVLEVWKGSTTVISNHSLLAEDPDSSVSEITFMVSGVYSGHVAYINDSSLSIKEFTQEEVDKGLVIFVETGEDDGGFKFQATDGTNLASTYLFQIRTKPLILTMQVKNDLRVFPNTMHPITVDVLYAVTSDKNFKRIMFSITSQPQKGEIVTLVSGRPQRVLSFSQEDIEGKKIFYKHAGYISGWSDSDQFRFNVSTAYAQPLPERMRVDISYGNINTGNENTLLSMSRAVVDEGREVVLRKENLDLTELEMRLRQFGRDINVDYVVTSLPRHGMLYEGRRELQILETFNQSVVNNGRIRYKHDDSDTTEDSFEYAVRIQKPQGSVSLADSFVTNFTIIVKPINDQPFKLVTRNPHVRVVQGASNNITGENLKTTDLDTPPDGIVYNIVTGPQNGKLIFWDFPNIKITTFTQADLDKGRLLFQHDGSKQPGAFYFKVSDGKFSPYYKIFNIHVLPLKIEIVANKPVELIQSHSSVYVTTKYFNITTNGPVDNIWYDITREPEHGKIYFQDSGTKTFSQSDLDKNVILYIQKDMTAGSDFFMFDLYTKNIDFRLRDQRIDITVIPLIKQGPFEAPAGSTTAITVFSLDASELANITGGNPTFDISDPPKHGSIVKTKSRGRRAINSDDYGMVDSFTHEDVIYTKVYYVADTPYDPNVKSDNFSYSLRATGVQPAGGVFSVRLEPPEPEAVTERPLRPHLTPRHGDRDPGGGGARQPDQDEDPSTDDNSDKKESDPTSKEAQNPNISNDYIIVAVVVSLVLLIVIIAVVIVLLLRRKRRRDMVREETKTRPKPRPYISGPLQLEQPHVHIEPQVESAPGGYDQAVTTGHNAASNIPVINVSHGEDFPDKHVSSPPRSPDLSRQEVSKTVPACKVTPLIEIPESTTEDASAEDSLKSTTSGEMFNFDWNLMDPDLLQHCRTTTPVLRKNQYWV